MEESQCSSTCFLLILFRVKNSKGYLVVLHFIKKIGSKTFFIISLKTNSLQIMLRSHGKR